MRRDRDAPSEPIGLLATELATELDRKLVATLPEDERSSPPPASGTMIGRYRVVETIGGGGMGIVVAAIDPVLQRKVALKLVRPSGNDASDGQQRLVGEAQAMARLSHPNVVTVYEVGSYADGVFIAMELVRGTTLTRWLDQPDRSPAAIIEVFRAAGSGLAAAHRAGIVHRDFKPDNVLVDRDGRVRVADFGVASKQRRKTTGPPVIADEPNPTETSAIVGTPRYMAPEQHRGELADARADQFAFCVALYEALYRQSPFAGDSYASYCENVLNGRIREPPHNSRVANSVRTLCRGLAVNPAERFPSMEALLDALPKERRRETRYLIGAAAAFALIVAGIGWWQSTADDPDPCGHAGDPVAAIWNPLVRSELAEVFVASGRPAAAFTYARIAGALDRQASELVAARVDTCAATAIRRDQSADVLDRRIACVDRRGGELAVLIEIIGELDRTGLDRAIEATATLQPVAPCSDRGQLLAAVAPPSAAQLAGGVHDLQRQVDRAGALIDAGRHSDGRDLAAAALAASERLDYPPLIANASYAYARALAELRQAQAAADAMLRTSELAAAARDDVLLAKAWIDRYTQLGAELHQREAAATAGVIAGQHVVRAGKPAELEGLLARARGTIAYVNGDYPSAVDALATAVNLLAVAAPRHPRVADTMLVLGSALQGASRYREARDAIDRALTAQIEAYGKLHPLVARSFQHRGILRSELDDAHGSLDDFIAALAIARAVLPSDHPSVASLENSVAVAYRQVDSPREALVHSETAVALLSAHRDVNPAQHINALMNLAGVYQDLTRYDRAIATCRRALLLAESKLGADHVYTGDVLHQLADTEYEAGHIGDGDRDGERALKIRQRHYGTEHRYTADTLTMIALGSDDARIAFAYATRAIAIYAQTEPKVGGEARAARGKALVALGQSREATKELAEVCPQISEYDPALAARCGLWLADAQVASGRTQEAIATVRRAIGWIDHSTNRRGDVRAKLTTWLSQHR